MQNGSFTESMTKAGLCLLLIFVIKVWSADVAAWMLMGVTFLFVIRAILFAYMDWKVRKSFG